VSHWAHWFDAFPNVIEEVRGKGLILGLKCRNHLNTDLRNAALDPGSGHHRPPGDNVLRLLPPLNLTDEDISAALEKLHAACALLNYDLREACCMTVHVPALMPRHVY